MTDPETPEIPTTFEAPLVPAEDVPVASAAPASAPAKPKGYAIIETGGKQYRVSVGDRISVERLPDEAGGDDHHRSRAAARRRRCTRVGTPLVDGATVSAQVEDHFRGEKIIVFKYKPKKRYRRRTGHRQELTRLAITAIAS